MRAALLLVILLAGCATPGGQDSAPLDAASPYALSCEGLAQGNASWKEACLAFASPNDSPSKTEVDVAVNPKDPGNVVVSSKDLDRKASPCVWAVAQVTKDGGRSWKTSYVGGDLASRQPTDPLYGWRCITDPIMVFDAQGTLYYSLQASREEALQGVDLPATPVPAPVGVPHGGNMYMARSKDGGATWDKVVLLLPGDGSAVFHDFMRMAVNPKTGSVYTIWNQYTQPNDVFPVLVASRDGGESADPPSYPTLQAFPQGIENRGLAVAKDGTTYIGLDAGSEALLMTSTDDGRTWSGPVSIAKYAPVPRMMRNNSFRTGSDLELAVDNSGGPRDGWIYATYGELVNDQSDLKVVVSKDHGKTWSKPVTVGAGAHAVNDQWMARPFVDRRGALHLVYLTREHDPANFGIDAAWAYSEDGGATWNVTRLTTQSFDGGLGIHQFGGPFLGDYLGIAGAGDWIYMGFPTTHTGRAELAVAKVHVH